MSKILVTGGAGYIGSHTVVDLAAHGFEPIIADNLVNSGKWVLGGLEQIMGRRPAFHEVDLCNWEATAKLFEQHTDIEGIIHFAALKAVGESTEQPLRYFHNNINSLLNVMRAMEEFDVPHLIFSSSCSVYGNSKALPVTEETPTEEAESPYARTKQIGEQILTDWTRRHQGKNAVLLRYFNPAGAHESGLIGEAPTYNVTNLVPVITETAAGKRAQVTVFGDDYATRDGSCIRDYIHVMDVANAHTRCLQYLIANKNESNCEVFNVGIGAGVTVLEAVRAFEKVADQQLNYTIGPRRAGDVVAIYANYDKAAEKLGWEPQYDIEDIMRSAWQWENVKADRVEQPVDS